MVSAAGVGTGRIEVLGARQLRATLRAAGNDLDDLKGTHAAVAAMVAARAAGIAPTRTGALAGSVRGNTARTMAVVRAGGARTPYAGPIHWGWPAHSIAANPFASRAATDSEPAWLRLYLDGIDRALAKVKGV